MEVAAKLQFARLSPQKCRLVCDQVRGLKIERAIDILKFSRKKVAENILKLLNSAIANAEHNNGANIDDLKIKKIFANQGPTYKRMHAKAKGRGTSVLKPTSHIVIILSDEE